jgi:predicted outer membrane repeat protein
MICKSFFLLLTVSLIVCTPLYADTIPGGDIYGTWYQANSPYYITGDITIPVDSILTIEPGVEVCFLGDYSLTASGVLEAVGTVSDSIHFFPEDTVTGWSGIICYDDDVGQTNLLSYCTIAYADSGIINDWESLRNATISHCDFSKNTTAIFWAPGYNLTLQITDCTFRHNEGTIGAAICIVESRGPVEITRCLFQDNTASDNGGAINIRQGYYHDINISDCAFLGNTAGNRGGAIYAWEVQFAAVVVEHCTFGENQACYDGASYTLGGGAIYANAVEALNISYCCFYENISLNGRGHSIRAYDLLTGAALILDHCTFWGHYGSQADVDVADGDCLLVVSNSIFANYWLAIYNDLGTVNVEYSDFATGTYGAILNPPSGFGTLDRVNYNGDSCDVYGNIFMDPMFADTLNFDLHLTAGSPCIDAGDTLFAYDPDSTITDMGAYYFDQRTPEIELPVSVLDFDSVTVNDSLNLSFNIYNIGDGNLLLYDITNSLAVFTNDWNPSDSIVLPGDSLGITVTFNPNDTLSFTDTLRIDNNDSLVYVELMGIGKPVSGISEDILASPLLELCGTNPATTFPKIRFGMPKGGKINLSVYDITGRCVKTLADGEYDAGIHEVTLDGTALSQGVYFCVMKAGETCLRRKLVLLK